MQNSKPSHSGEKDTDKLLPCAKGQNAQETRPFLLAPPSAFTRHLFRNYFFQWNCFTVWPKNVQCMKCNAHLPSKQANESLHKAICHAGFLHSIEKKKVLLCACMCVCSALFSWLVGERVLFFFLCCKRDVKDFFFAIAHFDSSFSLLYVWRRCACYSFSQSSAFCIFSFIQDFSFC